MSVSPSNPEIVPATLADVGKIVELLHTVNQHIYGKTGSPEWSDIKGATERINIAVQSNRDFFIQATDGRKAIGNVILDQSDTQNWSDAGDNALYIHQLMAHPEEGRGLGRYLLGFAAGQALGAKRRWLRLDCREASRGLKAYYERLGFIPQGVISYPSRRPRVSYQVEAAFLDDQPQTND